MRFMSVRLNGREFQLTIPHQVLLLFYSTIVNGRSRTNGYWYVENKTKIDTDVQATALMHNPPPQIT